MSVNINMENSTTPNTQSEIASISVQDLMAFKSVIEVACQRGTFRAEEMKNVGLLYEKLDAFLKSIEPKLAEPDGPSTTPDQAQQGE